LTGHFISDDFTRQFALIYCKPIEGSKTGENISDVILSALDEAQISEEKRILLTRDAARSMIKAARVSNLPSIDCFIHKLQLAITDALMPFKDDLKAARKVPSLFNRSSNFRKAFEDMSDQLSLNYKVLIQVRSLINRHFKFFLLGRQNSLGFYARIS